MLKFQYCIAVFKEYISNMDFICSAVNEPYFL